MSTSQTVLVVDDHPMVRSGIAATLRAQNDLDVIEAEDADEAYREFLNHRPDIVITDISLPGASGLELIQRLRSRSESVRIIVLSILCDAQTVTRALEAGANGFLSKTSAPECLAQAIDRVSLDRLYIDPETSMNYAAASLRRGERRLDNLSPREYQIFMAFAQGNSARDIAEAHHISVNTVGNHKRSIFRKLGVSTLNEFTLLAVQEGIISSGSS